MNHFGEKLRRLRGGESQKSVAEALDMPQTTLSSLEKQQTIPRGDVLMKLANYFSVPIEYFYDEPRSSHSPAALAWLDDVRSDVKGRDTIATHSMSQISPEIRKQIAKRLKEKYDEISNK